jgi:LPXTG-site transpeptidase (sortase) family protein
MASGKIGTVGFKVVMVFCLTAAVLCTAAPPAATQDGEGPRLLGYMPVSDGGELGRDTTVSLSFNRPMDLESLAAAVYFEPPVEFAVSGEAECLVVPVNLLEPAQEYTFRLRAGSAEDLAGGICGDEVVITFRTRDDAMEIEIPAFPYSGKIREGKDPQGMVSLLGNGVGHYTGTGRPGRGNFVIMAHASGQVDFTFNRLFAIGEGDRVIISYGGRDYVYGCVEGIIVQDSEVWILDATADAMVTVFVCCDESGQPSPTFHPPYRYVVRTGLLSATPRFEL